MNLKIFDRKFDRGLVGYPNRPLHLELKKKKFFGRASVMGSLVIFQKRDRQSFYYGICRDLP